jgi:hypothetical protein
VKQGVVSTPRVGKEGEFTARQVKEGAMTSRAKPKKKLFGQGTGEKAISNPKNDGTEPKAQI